MNKNHTKNVKFFGLACDGLFTISNVVTVIENILIMFTRDHKETGSSSADGMHLRDK